MDKKVYIRGMAGQCWYNFTEGLAYALLYRPTPKELTYIPKVYYGKEKKQYVNLCYPTALENKKKPLFIYVHGGGWISGITEMRNHYLSNWAKQGFFTASVSYTVAPQKIYPESVKEVFSAIDYLCDNAEKYGIDTENVVIAGESAGGYFISYVACAMTDRSILDKQGIEFSHYEDFSVRAMVFHSGCYNLERLMDSRYPQSKFPDVKMMVSTFLGKSRKETVQWLKTDEGRLAIPKISEAFPPMFIAWTTRDALRHEAFDLMKELDKYGVPYKQFKGDGIIGNHAWTIVTVFKKGKQCFEQSKAFVSEYLPEYF